MLYYLIALTMFSAVSFDTSLTVPSIDLSPNLNVTRTEQTLTPQPTNCWSDFHRCSLPFCNNPFGVDMQMDDTICNKDKLRRVQFIPS